MSTLAQPSVIKPHSSAATSQTASQAHSSSPSITGTTSSLAAVPAPATARSYANATKRSSLASGSTSSTPAVGGSVQHPQHGKSPSVSPVNGRSAISPAIPTVNTPTIVNGNNTVVHSLGNDHNRKPSVTITAAGSSGYLRNGGPVDGARPSNLQFGSINASSPALSHSSLHQNSGLAANIPINPRITSPQTSPSPIPQPQASGGRPSNLPINNQQPVFGQMGGESNEVNVSNSSSTLLRTSLITSKRPLRMASSQLVPGPQPQHMRRESSQSAHSDMGNPNMSNMGPGPGRGGYGQNSNRGGRPFSYQPGMSYSPNPAYRSLQNQPRGGPQQFGGQGRPMPYPNSPHQSARSPALTSSNPVTPHMAQVQMAGPPPMHPQHYGYQHTPQNYMPYGAVYDPNTFYYSPPMHPAMGPTFVPPPASPRPPYIATTQPQHYIPAQYGVVPQAQPMSRTNSQISTTDRPNSSLGQPQAPPMVAVPSQGHVPPVSRATQSPKPNGINFVKPGRKSAAISIKDPTTGAAINLEKSASPARATPSPVKSITPPPNSTSTPEPVHKRGESQGIKTDAEKKNEFKDEIARKIEADRIAEERRKKEEAEKVAREKEEQERKIKEKAEAEEREREREAAAKREAEEKQRKAEEEAKAKKAAEEEARAKKAAEEEAARKAAEVAAMKAEEMKAEDMRRAEAAAAAAKMADEIEQSVKAKEQAASKAEEAFDFDALEAEYKAMEEAEARAEAAYQAKKQVEKEAKDRAQKEARSLEEEALRKAEHEAEEAEERRLKELGEKKSKVESAEDAKLFASLGKHHTFGPKSSPLGSGSATPVSDHPTLPVPVKVGGKREKPAALKLEMTKTIEPAQPSAALQSLRSARKILHLSDIMYPPSISSPNPALNNNAPMGRFKYDKEFLIQFQRVFTEKPMEDWDSKVKDTVGDPTESGRPQSARTPSMGMNSRTNSRHSVAQPFNMGSFGAPGGRIMPPGVASEQAFGLPNAGMGNRSVMNPLGSFPRGGFPMGQPFRRTPSSMALQGQQPQSPRVGSHRGREGSRRNQSSKKDQKREAEENKHMPLTAGQDLKPLETSKSGWKPLSLNQHAAGPVVGNDGYMPPDVVQRKVKAALNKMTPEKFDKIADQILTIVAQSKNESDGRTLRQVIQLTFDKATDESHWASMYAMFCKRMLEMMSQEIKDETIKDKQGNPVVGGNLFRKYLLNRCQEEFERGWTVNLPEQSTGGEHEAVMMSDEYYVAAAAKRRGLGLVKFIGELFKLGMLTERIMHECVKKLLEFKGMPDEAEIESLTSLLRTVGRNLDDSEKGHMFMDAYFQRIEKLIDLPGLNSRLKFMLMDIFDLRRVKWISRNDDKGPKTLQEIHAEAIAQQQAAEAERMRQQSNRNRPQMGRGDARNFSSVPQSDYKQNTVPMDDLRRLNNQNRIAPRQFSHHEIRPLAPQNPFGQQRTGSRRGLGALRSGDNSGSSSRAETPLSQKERKEREAMEATRTNSFGALANLEPHDHHDGQSPPSASVSPSLSKIRPAIERTRSKSPIKKDAVGRA